jgi:hypothetical protein
MDEIRWFDYLWRVTSVGAEFDIARKSIGLLSGNPETLRVHFSNPAMDSVLRKSVQEQTGPERLARELQQFLLRLNQNELVLKVALFETFLKNVHRTVLRRNPRLLRGDKTPILLGDLVDRGFDAIIEEEIESRLVAIDRKPVHARAEYFRDRLQAPWGPLELVNAAHWSTKLRNRILHEDPDAKVSPEDLNDTVIMALCISGFVCQSLVERHPDAFNPQDRINLGGRPWENVYKGLKWIPSRQAEQG